MKAADPTPARTTSATLSARPNSVRHRAATESGTLSTRELRRRAGIGRSEPRILRKIHNRFQLNSLVAQVLFVQLHEYVEAQYETAGASKRQYLQTGHAWTSFSKLFEPLDPIERIKLFENLLRFANDESYAPARGFFLAYAPVSFEHDASGKYIGPGVWKPEAGSRQAALRVVRTLHRWCDWLEALIHFQVHRLHHSASLTLDLDKAIILLWPLFKEHNWSFGTLLQILRSRTACGCCFLFQTQAQLEAYCKGPLKLCRTDCSRPQGASPEGLDVADRLLKFLPAMR